MASELLERILLPAPPVMAFDRTGRRCAGMDSDNLERWLTTMRPRLHAFCGRMMGSAIDGEDVVQEALARAAAAYADADPAQPEAWLFRIARNASIDALRQRRGATADPTDQEETPDPRADSAARAEVTLGFTAFLPLPPPQRASVVLVDVLGYSLAETATILETSVAAVKATLHRGRSRLADPPEPAPISEQEKLRLRAYADLFNARAFDALRDLLAAEVQLVMPPNIRRDGKQDVSIYYARYSDAPVAWRMDVALIDGRPALLAMDPADPQTRFPVLLDWSDGRIVAIRDFHYARYVMDGIAIARI